MKQKQQTFPNVPQDSSQEQRIIHFLLASWPEWTPAPVLSRISLQYNARIFGLRRRGWQIESRVQVVDSVRHGSFRLARPGTFPNPKSKPLPAPQVAESLFGDLTPRHRDDG